MNSTTTTTTPSTAAIDAAVPSLPSPWRDALQAYIVELELRRQLAARRLLRSDARLGRPRKPDHELKRPRRAPKVGDE